MQKNIWLDIKLYTTILLMFFSPALLIIIFTDVEVLPAIFLGYLIIFTLAFIPIINVILGLIAVGILYLVTTKAERQQASWLFDPLG